MNLRVLSVSYWIRSCFTYKSNLQRKHSLGGSQHAAFILSCPGGSKWISKFQCCIVKSVKVPSRKPIRLLLFDHNTYMGLYMDISIYFAQQLLCWLPAPVKSNSWYTIFFNPCLLLTCFVSDKRRDNSKTVYAKKSGIMDIWLSTRWNSDSKSHKPFDQHSSSSPGTPSLLSRRGLYTRGWFGIHMFWCGGFRWTFSP